ncbi:MAG TPA: hypothetical protein VK789_24995 [Bryobacteraceae bacterium]|nr:hypothetical protein [Bryobacteraceae bacterium]
MICPAVFCQTPSLSVTNYQLLSQQTIQRIVNVTYKADLINTGAALGAVSATVTSLDPSIQVAAGQSALQFTSVPGGAEVTSSNTFTLQLRNGGPVDFSQLQWSFQTSAILLPATITVPPGQTLDLPVSLGAPAPAGGVFISLASGNTGVAGVFPAVVFVPEGMTSAPRTMAVVTGNSAGSAMISASATGYVTASAQIQVNSGGPPRTTMSFWPASLTISAPATQNLTLNLSEPAVTALTVDLNSSNPAVAKVPATVSFPAGGTSVPVPVTGVVAGSVTITASAANIPDTTAGVTITHAASGSIVLPTSVSVTQGQTANLPVSLVTPAPSGGVTVTLVSSAPAIGTVSPSTILVPQGMTTALGIMPTVTGVSAGSTTITASAPGYTMAASSVQVSAAAQLTMSFSPASLTINGVSTGSLTLNLSALAPAPLTVNLSSGNSSIATVPATVSFAAGASSVSVPVTSLSAGSVTITASAANIASTSAAVTVTQPAGGGITIISSVTVAPGSSANFPVTLGSPAPPGGVSITFGSTNSSVATVWPASVFIPQGQTSARASTIVNGIGSGTAVVTASAPGFPTASSQVQVTGGSAPPPLTISFSQSTLTINGTATQNLTLNLSASASTAFTVNLASSNTSIATVPPAVTFAAGAASVSVPVTAISAGSATITASGPNVASATASVTVTQQSTSGTISLLTSDTVGLNESAVFPVTLSSPAPAGGVTVSLSSSNTSTVTVTSSVFIGAGNTFSLPQPQLSGISLGSATITASASGYASGTSQIQVTPGGGSSFFSPITGLTINPGTTQSLTLNLSSASAGGLTASLTSSNPAVATVPASVTFVAGSGAASVPVTGVAPGSVTITASTPNFGTATSNVTIASLNGVSVTWYGACWDHITLNGFTGNYQGINFSLITPTPVVVNGTLFFTPNCDPGNGVDNMNDTGALTGSGNMIQGFSHYPNVIPTSAIYWIGTTTTNGLTCPIGSPCSGCVTYSTSTPSC